MWVMSSSTKERFFFHRFFPLKEFLKDFEGWRGETIQYLTRKKQKQLLVKSWNTINIFLYYRSMFSFPTPLSIWDPSDLSWFPIWGSRPPYWEPLVYIMIILRLDSNGTFQKHPRSSSLLCSALLKICGYFIFDESHAKLLRADEPGIPRHRASGQFSK